MSSDLEYARDLDYEPEPDSYSEMALDIDAANGGSFDGLVIVREERKWSVHEVAELRRSIVIEAESAVRNQIRTELINWIESLPNPAVVHREYFRTLIDRICPPD